MMCTHVSSTCPPERGTAFALYNGGRARARGKTIVGVPTRHCMLFLDLRTPAIIPRCGRY
eukprot:3876888-Rhodomonas_salina.1